MAQTDSEPTGAAFIFVSTETGDNAIIVSSGAAGTISVADIDAAAPAIERAAVFVTQFEQPIEAARRGLELARRAGVTTILNPAPAARVDDSLYALCDYVTPNETEASTITGLPIDNLDQARAAGDALLERGAGVVVITLGEKGALYHRAGESIYVPAFPVDIIVETTGAGDAFNGGFAVALAEAQKPIDAVRFACATAALSVGKAGTAPQCQAEPRLISPGECLRALNPSAALRREGATAASTFRAGMHGSGSELANASATPRGSATAAAAAIVFHGTSFAKAEALFDLRAEAAIVRNERSCEAPGRRMGAPGMTINFRRVFGTRKPVIGMVHFGALPGTPLYDPEAGIAGLIDGVARTF